MDLTPIGTPPSRFARWCPRCCAWLEHTGARRCLCGAALVRQGKAEKARPGELRPGVVPEFTDTRDRNEPGADFPALSALGWAMKR